MKKKFDELFKKNDTALFNCWIDKELLDQVRAARTETGLTFREIVEGCFKYFLEEFKEQRKKK